MQIKTSLEGTQIEELSRSVLLVDKDNKMFWRKYRNTNSVIEGQALNNIMSTLKENNEDIVSEIEEIYTRHFKKKDPSDIIEMNIATEKVLNILLDRAQKGVLVNKQVLLSEPILFNGRHKLLRDILFGHKMTEYGPQ